MTNLHYDIHPGDGPPMLFVHGMFCSRALWDLNLKALGKVCTPVTVELYGHGRSGAPMEKEAYTPEHYVAEFEKIRKALGVTEWFLCGHSLGASLTMHYAFKYPQHTIAQIFTNSSSAIAPPREEERPAEKFISHLESGGLELLEEFPVHPRFAKNLPDDVKRSLLVDAALLNPGGVARTVAYTSMQTSLQDRLQENTTPTLLVCGVFEKRFAPFRDLVEEKMPNTRIVDVKAGHAANAECAEEFNAVVTEFVVKRQAN